VAPPDQEGTGGAGHHKPNPGTQHVTGHLNHATGYQQHSYRLNGFAGQTVTLKFTGTEDSSLQTSFVVDDTAVNAS
jgi:hypothetical protein